MSIGAGEMHVRLPLYRQSKEALASRTQVERDWKEGRVQGSSVTSRISPETGGRMEACLLLALFPHRTPYKLLHCAFGETTRG